MNNDMVVNSDELYEFSSDLSRNNNITIETGENGRARTKEQFNSIDELKGLEVI